MICAVVVLGFLADVGTPHEARIIRVITPPAIVNPQPGVHYTAHHQSLIAEGQLPSGLIVRQTITTKERQAGHFTVFTRASGHALEVSPQALPTHWAHGRLGLAAVIGAVIFFLAGGYLHRLGRRYWGASYYD